MKLRAFILFSLCFCLIGSCKLFQASSEQSTNDPNMNISTTPAMIKELIEKMKNELEIDQERLPELIHEVEQLAVQTKEETSKAFLHSMTAELYSRYYQQSRWKIDRRTALEGYIPDDIREWSANLFTDKIKEELALSLLPVSLLQETPISLFAPILEKGENTQELRPTLYDFLMQRAVEMQPSAERYEEWLSFLRKGDNKKATVLTELDFLQFTYPLSYNKEQREKYKLSLESLLKKYGEYDFSTEIRAAQIKILERERFNPDQKDSILDLQYAIAQEGIRLYPNYDRIGMLKNVISDLEAPSIHTEIAQTIYPNSPMEIKLNYKNVKKVTVDIYESLQDIKTLFSYRQQKEKKTGKLIKKMEINLPVSNTYSTKDTLLHIPMETLGLYECRIGFSGEESNMISHIVSVSRLAAVTRVNGEGQREVLVTDFETGQPIPNATVNYWGGSRRELKYGGSRKSDSNGLAILPEMKDLQAFQASLAGDDMARLTSVYPEYGADGSDASNVSISLFSDRGLYRPGQALYFKGIVYLLNKKKAEVLPNKSYSVVLRDANDKEVATSQVKTNEFGSFNGEFTIPKQGLTGAYYLSIDGYVSAYIQMEEYKRPTFAVELLPIKEEVAFGDQVTIKGKAVTFSGVALQEGNVTWTIERQPFFWRIGGGRSIGQVASGITTLSSDGTFSLSFRPEKSDEVSLFPQHYMYEVKAMVTDSKGETQEVRFSFPVGETSFVLSIDLPEMIEKSNVKASVSAQLLNGEKSSATGEYHIVELVNNKNLQGTILTEAKQVSSGTFVADEALPSTVFSSLPSGHYRIKMEAKDGKNRIVKGEHDFVLYGKQDKKPPIYSPLWQTIEKKSYMPGEVAEWQFGTSIEEAYILYELYSEGKKISSERLLLSNEIRNFKLLFKEEFGDGVVASFSFVKKGELYVAQIPMGKKQPDRKLTVRPEIFRDRLLPGANETWTYKITDNDSLVVAAEVLAGMYDSSLDKILPFSWYFSPERHIHLGAPRFRMGSGFDKVVSSVGNTNRSYINVSNFQFDQLDWQGVFTSEFGSSFYISGRNALPQMKSSRMDSSSAYGVNEVFFAEDEMAMTMDASDDKQEAIATGGEGKSTDIQIRTNFNETAFFFPHLTTNEKGELSLTFTVPESNTTWKLQALAHTKDLKYGMLTQEIITSKPLMVVPNLPRYLRQGDKVTISSQILNQTEDSMTGTIHLEWFDPETDKVIEGLQTEAKSFTLAGKGQSEEKWTITAPSDNDLLGCRIVANTAAGSDGEQHVLPVLSNQILVTESTPFYLLEEGEQEVKINQPDKATPFRVTLEVSGNPVWYAVQALPTVTTPSDDNVLSWFAAYYGNTLANSIANSTPRVQQVIKQWMAQKGGPSTLLSNLEKNEELKNILLEETPWVLTAENESEQKQRLSLLFDINRAQNQREQAMSQLLQQQTDEGGWGWFKGFAASRSMTLSILKGMTQLVQLGAVQYNEAEKKMQMSALRYLDISMQKDFESLKKWDKDWEKAIPTFEQLEFLYVRSSYRDIPEQGEAREAIRFYTHQAEKNWEKLSLYGKTQVALLMHRNGKKEIAQEIMTWFQKTATSSEEQGMFWANNRRGNDFFVSPIDVHCLLMLAFEEVSPQPGEEVDRMKQWLLNQKRTQNWESVPSTINAIHAILLTGSDWLKGNNTVTVKWGQETLDTKQGEVATGYLKKVVEKNEPLSHHKSFSIRKEGEAPAWGAVYNQYFAPIDQVKGQSSGLHVEKMLFVEKNKSGKKVIEPVTEKQSLKVGDKVIVRLVIRTDQEMNYVHLKDLRSGAFEPAGQLSGVAWQDGTIYYRSPKDVSENFFFQRLPEGTFVVEYPVYVSRSGEYAGGICTIQCLYAPEFVSHTSGERIVVKD